MIKVLIVDDEPKMRKGLISKIDWSALRLEFAGEAADGVEGLAKVEACRPDMVIVDVRMPEMDGLTFVGRVRSLYPEIRCIIVSGYSEFEYARQAMKHGVSDYLLKPVDDDDLRNVLVKVTEQIEMEKKDDDYRRFLERRYESHREEHRERDLSRFLEDAGPEGAAELLGNCPPGLPENGKWIAAVIRLEPFTLPFHGFRPDDEPLIWFGVQNILNERLFSPGVHIVVFKHAFRRFDCVVLAGMSSDREIGSVKNGLKETLTDIRTYLKLEGSIGIGEPGEGTASLSVSWRQAESAVKSRLLKGSGCLFDYSGFRTGEGISISIQEERVLFGLLEEKKEDEIKRWLNARFKQLLACPSAGYPQLERLFIDLDTLFRKYLSEQMIGEPEMIMEEQSELVPFLLNLHNWQQAYAEIRRKAVSIMRFDKEKGVFSGEEIVSEVKQYIERCFHENLSLKWVAEHYFIHPNYFCKLFKDLCGENFNDYLSRVRMEHAERLLSDPSLKIGRIAELIGYKDATYFSTVFKRTHAMSPLQYRERLTKQGS